MDSTVDAAPADELRELAHLLRAQLRRHRALGAWAAPGGPTAAYDGAAEHAGAASAVAASDTTAHAAAASDTAEHVAAAERAAATAAVSAATAATAIGLPEERGAASRGRGGARDAAERRAGDRAGRELAAAEQAPPRAGHGELADAMAAFEAAMGEAARDDDGGFSARQDEARAPAWAREGEAHAPARGGQLFPAPEPADAAPLGRRTLAQIREELGECTRCKLHATRRTIVFGVGAEDTPLMFVGEAPGEQEDRRGEPFVGPAGELLDKMIEAMGWTRDTVYIANTTKCRPPGNRNPQPDELAQCTPFLDAQIRAISPRIIVTLGRPAANHVLRKDAPISALRGRFHDRGGVKVMPTFHPAYLLRDPDKKKDTWSDLKQVIVELERLGIKAPRPSRG